MTFPHIGYNINKNKQRVDCFYVYTKQWTNKAIQNLGNVLVGRH